MNTLPRLAAIFLFSSLLSPSAFSQGSLTPPGPPAPTMKTLDQVEPRTPLKAGSPGVSANDNGGFTITAPGSYYLTANLTVSGGDGIDIVAGNVTVDLSGFTISCAQDPPTGNGIRIEGGNSVANVAIQNGNISGTVTRSGSVFSGGGFRSGITTNSIVTHGIRVRDISVQRCLRGGIVISSSGTNTVERCTVRTVGESGIVAATVSNCAVSATGLGGIGGGSIHNCRVIGSLGIGISARTISNCAASDNGTTGLLGDSVTASTADGNQVGINATTVKDCTATGNTTHGIRVTGLAKDNQASGNGNGGNGAGIYFTGNGVRIEGNNCFENDWGIQSAPSSNGFIVRNSCRGNAATATNATPATGNYDFDRASNTYGPVVTVNGDMSANSAASHPAANIQY